MEMEVEGVKRVASWAQQEWVVVGVGSVEHHLQGEGKGVSRVRGDARVQGGAGGGP